MDSILDFASKLKRAIAVFAATVVVMVVMAGAGLALHQSAAERAVDEVWSCAKALHPSNSGDYPAGIDSVDSCRKTVEKLAAKRHLLRDLRYLRYLPH